VNFADALAQTAPQARTKSHVALVIEALEGTSTRDDILAALRESDIEHAHLGRALTKIAHEIGALHPSKKVSAQAVSDWRASNGAL
jgi:threonine aldolase